MFLSASIHLEHNHIHFDYTENQPEILEKSVQFEGSYYGFDEDDFLMFDEPPIPLESVITFIVNDSQALLSDFIAERPSPNDSIEVTQKNWMIIDNMFKN